MVQFDSTTIHLQKGPYLLGVFSIVLWDVVRFHLVIRVRLFFSIFIRNLIVLKEQKSIQLRKRFKIRPKFAYSNVFAKYQSGLSFFSFSPI